MIKPNSPRISTWYRKFRLTKSLADLFDVPWYISSYNLNDRARNSPLEYYMQSGYLEEQEPNRFFDSGWYREQANRLGYKVKNPLAHYVSVGEYENISPCPYLDERWYLSQNPDVEASRQSAFRHFVRHGANEGRDPNPYFETEWYQNNAILRGISPVGDMLTHYLYDGYRRGLNPSKKFDQKYYTDSNIDVSGTGIEPLRHFLCYGRKEGRSPIAHAKEAEIFDSAWYETRYAPNKKSNETNLEYYIRVGYKKGNEPHPLFDSQWYREQATKRDLHVENPLVHYCHEGHLLGLNPSRFLDPKWYGHYFQESDRPRDFFLSFLDNKSSHRNPNMFFDYDWYVETYNIKASSSLEAILHYISTGERDGLKPCQSFDPYFYLRMNPDVEKTNQSPLAHYLCYGRFENRKYELLPDDASPSLKAKIVVLKQSPLNSRSAFVVTHSADGAIYPHLIFYVSCLRQSGFHVTLIVAADDLEMILEDNVISLCDTLYIRENIGFDFAAWSHAWQIAESKEKCDMLLLTNDSIIGPINQLKLDKVFIEAKNNANDAISLTDNYEIEWHLQSFFMILKTKTLKSDVFSQFMNTIKNLPLKQHVIAKYETVLTRLLSEADLQCGALFPSEQGKKLNQTLRDWRQLLTLGMPFVKAEALRDRGAQGHSFGWQTTLRHFGYDPKLAHKIVQRENNYISTDFRKLTSGKNFDSNFYLSVYQDVANSGMDPWVHFHEFGESEGRLSEIPGLIDLLKRKDTTARDYILVVSHEAEMGGAPILSLNIAKNLSAKYNVIVLFLSGGPLIQSAKDIGLDVIGPISLGARNVGRYLIERLDHVLGLKCIFANTVQSRNVLEAAAFVGVPSIALIHEFTAYIRPRSAMEYVHKWANLVIFSTRLTLENARQECPQIANVATRILPQGLSPPWSVRPKSRDNVTSKKDIKTLLRPELFPDNGVIVIGSGLVEYRKGVDLFISVAEKVLKNLKDISVRFVWIGRGYSPERDEYSSFLADQIRRSSLQDHVAIVGEIQDMEIVYENTDILMLSSRLDPLPGVAIEAMSNKLPVVCFDRTSGISEVLKDYGLEDECVASYLDVDELASKIVNLLRSSQKLSNVRLRVSELCKSVFNFSTYVDALDMEIVRLYEKFSNEQMDIDTLVNSSQIDPIYYSSKSEDGNTRRDAVVDYVRNIYSGYRRRRLIPGFHSGIFVEKFGLNDTERDPTSEYVRLGQPSGPWQAELIDFDKHIKIHNKNFEGKIALHLHAYYIDLVEEIIACVNCNEIKPDLFISVKSEADQENVSSLMKALYKGRHEIKIVENRGRDLSPFFVTFGEDLFQNYDIVGHFHTKKSFDYADRQAIEDWKTFLNEHLLGGNYCAIDIIVSFMQSDDRIGLVIPDDPHEIGWNSNLHYAESLLQRSNSAYAAKIPQEFWFPIGSMFWARPNALRRVRDMRLQLYDFPPEPVPYDGSMLHALERLIGLSAVETGYRVGTTYSRVVRR